MTQILLVTSSILFAAGIVPYLIDVARKKTKPKLVSWFNWTLLTGIATAAALAEHEYASAALTASGTLATGLVFIAGIRYGDRHVERFDIICQVGAIGGLMLWIIFNDPLIALLATVSIDLLAALPTFKHAWQKPHEETLSTFVVSAIASIMALGAIETYTFSGLIYPVYFVLANSILATEIKFSPHRHGCRTT